MIRGAKSQLPRGRELQNWTQIGFTGAVTTSAKLNVAQQVRKSSEASYNSQHSASHPNEETKGLTPTKNGKLDQIMVDENSYAAATHDGLRNNGQNR